MRKISDNDTSLAVRRTPKGRSIIYRLVSNQFLKEDILCLGDEGSDLIDKKKIVDLWVTMIRLW